MLLCREHLLWGGPPFGSLVISSSGWKISLEQHWTHSLSLVQADDPKIGFHIAGPSSIWPAWTHLFEVIHALTSSAWLGSVTPSASHHPSTVSPSHQLSANPNRSFWTHPLSTLTTFYLVKEGTPPCQILLLKLQWF